MKCFYSFFCLVLTLTSVFSQDLTEREIVCSINNIVGISVNIDIIPYGDRYCFYEYVEGDSDSYYIDSLCQFTDLGRARLNGEDFFYELGRINGYYFFHNPGNPDIEEITINRGLTAVKCDSEEYIYCQKQVLIENGMSFIEMNLCYITDENGDEIVQEFTIDDFELEALYSNETSGPLYCTIDEYLAGVDPLTGEWYVCENNPISDCSTMSPEFEFYSILRLSNSINDATLELQSLGCGELFINPDGNFTLQSCKWVDYGVAEISDIGVYRYYRINEQTTRDKFDENAACVIEPFVLLSHRTTLVSCDGEIFECETTNGVTICTDLASGEILELNFETINFVEARSYNTPAILNFQPTESEYFNAGGEYLICSFDCPEVEFCSDTELQNIQSLGFGLGGQVHVIEGYDNKVIIGGYLFTVNDESGWNDILVSWENESYQEIGDYRIENVEIDAIKIVGDSIIVAGNFIIDGDESLRNLAIFHNGGWNRLGGGIQIGRINDIEFFEGEIYIGGFFSQISNVEGTRNIAKWNGENWESLLSGVNSEVYDIEPKNDKLFIGGGFTRLDPDGGNIDANSIAIWTDEHWDKLILSEDQGLVPNAIVRVIKFFNNEMYIGISGAFYSGNQNPSHDIQKYVGDRFVPVGSNVNDRVYDIEIHKGEIYISGRFQDAGGNELADYLAKFDSEISDWVSATQQAINNEVFCLYSDNVTLYIGGRFINQSEDDSIDGIGRLDCGGIVSNINMESEKNMISVFPNPAIDGLTIQTSNLSSLLLVRVFNTFGREVFSQEITNNGLLDVSKLKRGTYFISIFSKDSELLKSTKFIKL